MNHFYDQYLYTMEIRGFAEVTRKTYLKHLELFFRFSNKAPGECNYDDVRKYLHHLIKFRKLSSYYINIAYSAIRFFYETTLRWKWKMKHANIGRNPVQKSGCIRGKIPKSRLATELFSVSTMRL